MNKNLNAVIYVIAGIIANLLIIAVLLLIGVPLVQLILGKDPNPAVSKVAYMMLMMLVLVGTFFIYNAILTLVLKKTNLEAHLPESRKKNRK